MPPNAVSVRDMSLDAKRLMMQANADRQSAPGGGGVFNGIRAAWSAFRTTTFGPLAPIAPIGHEDELEPRIWQYPVGRNVNSTPRGDEGITPFAQLIYLADTYDIARICISVKQQEVASVPWAIVAKLKGDGDKHKDTIEEVTGFFRAPDKQNDFASWVSIAMEEILVTDALSIYPRKDRKGDLWSLELISGDTIRPLVDYRGKRPLPPAPAYQQVLYGVPWSELTQELGFTQSPDGAVTKDIIQSDLLYLPMHQRTRSMYGRSPTEWIILTVNTALRRQLWDLAYYKDGNIPEGLLGLPQEWQPAQIHEFQKYWDEVIAGQPDQQRRLRFVPNAGRSTLPVYEFRKYEVSTEQQMWLLKITCAAYGVVPSEIGFTDDVNRATAQSQESIQRRRGTMPYLNFIARLINWVIVFHLKHPELEFQWMIQKSPEDELNMAKVNDLDVRNGIVSVDEVRESRGMQPIGVENYVVTRNGPILLKDAIANPLLGQSGGDNAYNAGKLPPKPAKLETDPADGEPKGDSPTAARPATAIQKAELAKWKRIAKAAVHQGKNPGAREFVTAVLPADVYDLVKMTLNEYPNARGVEEAFTAASLAIALGDPHDD